MTAIFQGRARTVIVFVARNVILSHHDTVIAMTTQDEILSGKLGAKVKDIDIAIISVVACRFTMHVMISMIHKMDIFL